MYRPTSTQKKGRANLYKHIGNVVKHSMSNPIKTSEEAREVFNTPPYYLTSKQKQGKPKDDFVMGFDISELAKEMNQKITEEQHKWFEQNYYKFDRTNPLSAEQVRIILQQEKEKEENV